MLGDKLGLKGFEIFLLSVSDGQLNNLHDDRTKLATRAIIAAR